MSKGQGAGIQRSDGETFFNLLSDQPLRSSDWQTAAFGINEKLTPLLNAILLESTQTPLAVMVTGGWGTGKTSAMKCLEGALRANEEVKPAFDGAMKADVCWFYPWKYQNKEDVWRGLISEVIIAAHTKSWERTKTDPGAILDNRSHITLWNGLGAFAKAVLDSIEIEAGVGPAKVKSKLGEALRKAGENVVHPEEAFLNSFEESLKDVIQAYYPESGQRRMVVFIDDLDRCMPPIALQVLEALKLYLNIPGLIFVAGVDKDILDLHIEKSYCDMVREEARTEDFTKKAKLYLDKMFQATLNIEPHEMDVEEFLDQRLNRSPFWLGLADEEREIYRKAIAELGGRTPRSIVRLFNRVLLAGVRDLEAVSEGIQSELISTVCEEINPALAGIQQQSTGREFLISWSRILRETGSNTIFLPETERRARRKAITKEEMKSASDRRLRWSRNESHRESEERQDPDKDFDHLQPLISLRYQPYEPLLGSLELALLLKIPYPGSEIHTPLVSPDAPHVSPDAPSKQELDILRLWIVKATGRNPSTLTDSDVLNIINLEINDEGFRDLGPVRWLSNLVEFVCSDSPVTDLSPLSSLVNLLRLDISRTPVFDLSFLVGISRLLKLDCSFTDITDLTPLSGLKNLEEIYFGGTSVSDLSPLSGLLRLQELDCSDSPVTDLSPLSSLVNLLRLDCNGTRVSSLSPLSGLTSLRELYCNNTKVTKEEVAKLQEALPNCKIRY